MPRSRYTNPIENLRSYLMIHLGIDRDERMADVEYLADVVDSAEKMKQILLELHMDPATKPAIATRIRQVVDQYEAL